MRPQPAPAGALALAHLRHLQLEGRSELTVYHRHRALLRLAAALPVPIEEATAEELYVWRASLRVADSTAAGYITNVAEFYRWLATSGHRPDDPSAGLPRPKMPRYLPRPVSEEDLAVALASADRRVRLWLVLAAWCGLRAKEIAGLRRESVMEKGKNPVLFVASPTAKGGRERAVPLSPFVLGELAAYKLPLSGPVFCRLTGEPGPVRPWLVSKVANNHLRDCGVPATLHQLRHRFGTMAYAGSQDLLAVQELMGHASPQTTAGYAKVAGKRAAEVVGAIPLPGNPVFRAPG